MLPTGSEIMWEFVWGSGPNREDSDTMQDGQVTPSNQEATTSLSHPTWLRISGQPSQHDSRRLAWIIIERGC